jgi:hypothetical protein
VSRPRAGVCFFLADEDLEEEEEEGRGVGRRRRRCGGWGGLARPLALWLNPPPPPPPWALPPLARAPLPGTTSRWSSSTLAMVGLSLAAARLPLTQTSSVAVAAPTPPLALLPRLPPLPRAPAPTNGDPAPSDRPLRHYSTHTSIGAALRGTRRRARAGEGRCWRLQVPEKKTSLQHHKTVPPAPPHLSHTTQTRPPNRDFET